MDVTLPGREIAREVCRTYTKMVHNLYGRFIKINPPIKGKSFENCLAVSALCEKLKINKVQYMVQAFRSYDTDWMEKVFKSPYPPFAVATGDKVREMVSLAFQKPLTGTPEQLAEGYLKFLGSMKREEVKFAIDSGLCGNDEAVKVILRKRMGV